MTNGAPSTSFVTNAWTYDVFLSFRGVDTRHGFTNNLHQALLRNGIYSFIDHEDLQVGEEISPALTKAIEGSRIGIVVFSENYASSTFCLEELAEILTCIKEKGRFVLPIFYKVNPCNVRRQLKSYKEAFDKHEKRFGHNSDKTKKWKAAMYQASNLKGEHFTGNEYEYDFIARIVQQVSKITNRQLLHVSANYLVGLESQVQNVIQLLHGESTEIKYMMGICGIGGIGKSVIARTIFNLIADQFEGWCFLADVRENSIDNRGFVKLQHELLFEILGREDMRFSDVYKGSQIIKDRLQQKKVLLVLDDIDKLEQLQMLAGGLDWFGPGSIIIITTRDKHVLRSHGVERIYEVEGLNDAEAYELFCWNAFKKTEVDSSYMNTSKRAIRYCKGLPLALNIIGCNLFGKTIEECESALDSYERNPNKKIQEILKVSYDGLEENEKIIFLDIACFFKGYVLRDVKDILLNSRGFNLEYAISVLVEKSLISIAPNYVHSTGNIERLVNMHDLIQDMGREIVKQESKLNPGERSRLWCYGDILDVLQENKGTDKTEFIKLCLPEDEVVEWDGEALKAMKNLKVLIIKNAHFSVAPKYLPNSLRILDWTDYPSTSLPQDFYPRKLVIFNLPNSVLALVKPLQKLKWLTCIDLSNNMFLKQLPSISGLPSLRKLNLEGCINLTEVDDLVWHHDRIQVLNFARCSKLRIFPHSVKSRDLIRLDLSGCLTVPNFPNVVSKDLHVFLDDDRYGSALKFDYVGANRWIYCCVSLFSKLDKLISESGEGPSRISYLRVRNCHQIDEVFSTCYAWFPILERLSLEDNKLTDEFLLSLFLWFPNLTYLNLSDNNFTILPWFPNLTYLDLSGNNFIILPACINQCCSLRRLVLDRCYQLREINGIPSCVKDLSALNCISLTPQSRSLLSSEKLHEGGWTRFTFPGSRIPNWFHYSCRGSSLSFWFRKKFPPIALCLVFGSVELDYLKFDDIHVRVNGQLIKNFVLPYCRDKWANTHVKLFDLQASLLSDDEAVEECINDGWNHVELIATSENFKVKRMGAYVRKRNHDTECLRFSNEEWRPNAIVITSEDYKVKWMRAFARKQNHDTGDVRFTSPTASRGVKRKGQSLDSVQNDGPKALRRKYSHPWSAKAFHILAFKSYGVKYLT